MIIADIAARCLIKPLAQIYELDINRNYICFCPLEAAPPIIDFCQSDILEGNPRITFIFVPEGGFEKPETLEWYITRILVKWEYWEGRFAA